MIITKFFCDLYWFMNVFTYGDEFSPIPYIDYFDQVISYIDLEPKWYDLATAVRHPVLTHEMHTGVFSHCVVCGVSGSGCWSAILTESVRFETNPVAEFPVGSTKM